MFIIAKRVRWRGLIAGAAVLALALGVVGAGSALARDARAAAGIAAPVITEAWAGRSHGSRPPWRTC